MQIAAPADLRSWHCPVYLCSEKGRGNSNISDQYSRVSGLTLGRSYLSVVRDKVSTVNVRFWYFLVTFSWWA
eukprot:1524725-Pleurochrysis_carterae.AAC.2